MGRLPNNESALFEPAVLIDTIVKLLSRFTRNSFKKKVQLFTFRSLYEGEARCMRKLCDWLRRFLGRVEVTIVF